MTDHPTRDTLAHWIRGLATGAAADAVERHLLDARCFECVMDLRELMAEAHVDFRENIQRTLHLEEESDESFQAAYRHAERRGIVPRYQLFGFAEYLGHASRAPRRPAQRDRPGAAKPPRRAGSSLQLRFSLTTLRGSASFSDNQQSRALRALRSALATREEHVMSGTLGKPDPDGPARAQAAAMHRDDATDLAERRGTARARANGEELAYGDTFAANYHKSLPHGPTGFVDATAYREYVDALLSQDHGRFEGLPVGNGFPESDYPRRTKGSEARRKLTSPFTGHVFDLEGADAGALAVDAAPTLASDELAAEMAELYVMALLRDTPFHTIQTGGGEAGKLTKALQGMPWFAGATDCERIGSRRRRIGGPEDLFRGSTPGSRRGPWLSQYMLVGNELPTEAVPGKAKGRTKGREDGSAECARAQVRVEDGFVFYGTQFIDQRSLVAQEGLDWLQTWPSWLDAQNGVDFSGKDRILDTRRFLTTPRDIATYVHFDALYQAYHVACNLMLAVGAPFGFDRGMPETLSRTRSAFASFGGPHVLSLVAEVATRALKLVWRQKWLHHRRLRPEAVAGLITLFSDDPKAIPNDALRCALEALCRKIPRAILDAVAERNQKPDDVIESNGNAADLPKIGCNYLLPMAFPEGSPTHPAYGAGHATVAGACVTVLKAFFEMYDFRARGGHEKGERCACGCPPELPWPLERSQSPSNALYGFGDVYVGHYHRLKGVEQDPPLTVQGELDKLAANISIARNFAGVHYYTDYFASVRQGERVTVSVLEEQAGLYNEPVSMSFTSFDGDCIRVRGHAGSATVSVVDRDGHAEDAADWYQRYGG